MAAEQHSPLEQFKVKCIALCGDGGTLQAFSFTNASLFMVLSVVGAVLLMVYGMRQRSLVPGRLQSVAELSYEFVANMVRENVGPNGRQYFPFIFSLFIFVLMANMLGMVPYSFTVTSHIIVTFALAIVVFLGITAIAIARNGIHFFTHFMPAGVPMWLAPIIVPIEIISYLSRPISLSLRLCANMLAGHTTLKVFAGFVVSMIGMGGVLSASGILPLIMVTALTALEFLIAFLQAYVFAILTCLYLAEAVNMEHH
ncbi:MAG: F0F1 ATP synthase subunit A [Ferrovibrio sp.]|uniref:F0F1 ATP synthase subunit A n=1 Tax=Ferrovibrio sp. TaxID=1917215 RepID=UPI002635B139|nr:F0F1 ATP synthase subunit A [Ferrovibrio sp.]MCW0233570.1 F0F1 ATP synthase subunit A [Ferrovibrio sp.]